MFHLDTCICIDFLRGRLPHTLNTLRTSDPRSFGVPAVVEAELRLGALKSASPEKNLRTVEAFLLPFQTVPFDVSAAREYAEIRSELERAGKLIEPNDLLIAATARAHGAVLVTHNTKEFLRVPRLRLEDWDEVPFS